MKRWKVWAAFRRPKDIKGNSKRPKGCGNCCFLDVVRVDRDLVVSPNEVDFGKDGAAGKAVVVVLYMWDWIPVSDGVSVQSLVVSTGPPTAVLLGHEMEGGRPQSLGASGCAVQQHGVELGLGHGQAFRIKAAWAAGYWRAGCCANVVRGVVPHLAMAAGWFRQLREFFQEAVRGRASCNDFYTGDGCWCNEARRGHRHDPVEQVVVPAVDEESVV
jgi:hypothetical protein